jgi:hypothetical protein
MGVNEAHLMAKELTRRAGRAAPVRATVGKTAEDTCGECMATRVCVDSLAVGRATENHSGLPRLFHNFVAVGQFL